jgi:flagellar export protein FliJ
MEENRLATLAESSSRAGFELENHKKEVLARQMELIQSPNVRAFELAALGSFTSRAKKREVQLGEICQAANKSLESQRKVVQAAQQRLQLLEKLRDRRFEEYRYRENRELEELASESYLAAFARAINDKTLG